MKYSNHFLLCGNPETGKSLLQNRVTQQIIEVPGSCLECQLDLEWGNLHLLFLSYDCPYEEILWILLLSGQGKIRSKRQLGPASGIAVFSSPRIVSAHTLEFQFDGPCRRRATVSSWLFGMKIRMGLVGRE
ncbi:hypothetical protein [Lignipirellula cremea]|uniref:Uncharacterized protein n=1 Tax=Lignipirellula cremea TaxID=2528010 RepID=A0A518DXQ1_9BACT|nr:hypothetical protein [Lignipirellula cremea]QDU96618.1 hypothetical protein Pla8534_44390 [Lignipirellula cremea]